MYLILNLSPLVLKHSSKSIIRYKFSSNVFSWHHISVGIHWNVALWRQIGCFSLMKCGKNHMAIFSFFPTTKFRRKRERGKRTLCFASPHTGDASGSVSGQNWPLAEFYCTLWCGFFKYFPFRIENFLLIHSIPWTHDSGQW